MPGREGGQAQRQRRLTRSRACVPASFARTRRRFVHAKSCARRRRRTRIRPDDESRAPADDTRRRGPYRAHREARKLPKARHASRRSGETTSSDGMLESRLPPRLLINAPPPKATRCSSPVGGSRSQPLSANGCVLACRASRIRTLTRPFESATRSRFARLFRWERGKHVTCCGGIRRRRRTVFQSLSGPRISHRRSSALS